jgi:hypothetical protein
MIADAVYFAVAGISFYYAAGRSMVWRTLAPEASADDRSARIKNS